MFLGPKVKALGHARGRLILPHDRRQPAAEIAIDPTDVGVRAANEGHPNFRLNAWRIEHKVGLFKRI